MIQLILKPFNRIRSLLKYFQLIKNEIKKSGHILLLYLNILKQIYINKPNSIFSIQMRPNRSSFVSTPSQKSLTEATDNSHGNISNGYFMPFQSQRRFTRKNNNSSVEKKKSRGNLDTQQDSSISINRHIETPKCSKQKTIPAYLKLNPELKDSRKSISHRQLNQVKTGSFTLQRTRVTRLSNFEDTIRISQQKHTSRHSRKSIDSISSRCGRTNNVAVLRTELQLKQKQLMVLQDERRRFRNNVEELKRKQIVLQQQLNKSQLQAREMKQNFQQNILDLEKKLEQYETYNSQLQKQNQKLKKQINQMLKQKKIVQRQLNVFIQKQVPKNIRQLQSCRQISQEQTINELKAQLNKNKTQVQRQMELMIMRLMQDSLTLRTEVKNLQIKNRLLQKKSTDSSRYLEAYTTIKGQYKTARTALKDANEQCELLRKQNVKMKKQIRKLNLHVTGKKPLSKKVYTEVAKQPEEQKVLSRVASEAESLNLSLSNCSK